MYKKVVKKATSNLEDTILMEFKNHIPDIIEKASNIYEDLLLGVTIEKDSLANPEFFYDSYIERITNFPYIVDTTNVQLNLPNEDTFDFSDDLVILKIITEGVVGNYLELPERDLNIILKSKGIDDKVKRRFRSLPGITSSDLPASRRFRLLNAKSELAQVAQEILDKKLIFFPFSNTPPLNVFEGIESYVDDNIENWISTGIDKALTFLEVRGI